MNKFLLICFSIMPFAAQAQDNPVGLKVECSLFSKKANGNWFASGQSTIEADGSKVTIAPGDIEARILQCCGPDLHSLLEKACSQKKMEGSKN